METLWVIVENFPQYLVSNDGQVVRNGRILKTQVSKHGYKTLDLCKDGVRHSKKVHRLVAEAFIPNPNKLPEVNHKDTNKLNNMHTNLEWVTKLGNMRHASKNSLRGDGVSYDKIRKKWKARYYPEPHKEVFLGRFDTKQEALNARNEAIADLDDSFDLWLGGM